MCFLLFGKVALPACEAASPLPVNHLTSALLRSRHMLLEVGSGLTYCVVFLVFCGSMK